MVEIYYYGVSFDFSGVTPENILMAECNSRSL